MHCLALKVGSKRTSTIWAIQKRLVAIGAESARKYTDITEDALLRDVR
jgi:hypothetical protein